MVCREQKSRFSSSVVQPLTHARCWPSNIQQDREEEHAPPVVEQPAWLEPTRTMNQAPTRGRCRNG